MPCKNLEDRKKYNSSEKGKAVNKKYALSEKGKIARRKAKKRYALRNPEKIKARNLASRRLPSKSCSIKGCDKKGEKHHEDYNKPLDVLYFCNQHHKQIKKIID